MTGCRYHEHERVGRCAAEDPGTGNFHVVGKSGTDLGRGRDYPGGPASV